MSFPYRGPRGLTRCDPYGCWGDFAPCVPADGPQGLAALDAQVTRDDSWPLRDMLGNEGFAAFLECVKRNGTKGLPVLVPGALGLSMLGQDQPEQQ